jgi:hypothetical protein
MSDSPFVGPRPFETEDRDRFFGRTRELEELFSLIIAHRAILVYAQSGAGKTSLLKAGVIPRLVQQGYKVLPPARVQCLLPTDLSPEKVANIFVFHALQHWAADLCHGPSAEKCAQTTLAEFLEPLVPPPRSDEESAAPMVIVFDQFEEFFTANAHRWQERAPFFEQLSQALEEIPTLKVVFVMREEYIAQLEPLDELLPEKLRTRMHLERLRGNSARSAVVKPFQSRGLSFDAGAAEKLLAELSEIRVSEGDKFREARGEFVEPVQLQVVCQSLWENLPTDWKHGGAASSDSPRLITLEYVDRFGDVNNALRRYYDRSVERAAAASQGRIGEGELRRWIGTALITPTGTRGLAFRGAPGATWRIPGLALKELEDAHVIRREERAGTITHELTHDRFIEPIQKSNEVWLARYQDAERIRAKLEEYANRDSGEFLDELQLREAEEYLSSPAAKILGATSEAQLLVRRSRKEVEDAKRRQAEELEEARRRAQEEERLHKAESERADAERARVEAITRARWRERIFAIFTAAVLIGLLWVSTGYWWKLHVEKRQRNERGRDFRNRAVSDLKVTNDPTGKVTALRNLSIALRNNPKDTEAAALAAHLLMKNTWCPPLSPDVSYGEDALLAAAFAPGSENEVFVVSGDGELLRWKKGQKRPKFESLQHLFDKPANDPNKASADEVALFSVDAQWLFVLMPTAVANEDAGHPSAEPTTQGLTPSDSAKIRLWVWSPQSGTYQKAGSDVGLPLSPSPSSRTTLTWNERAQHLIAINVRYSDRLQAACHVFRVARDGASKLQEISAQLTHSSVVAAGASPDALALGFVDGSVALVSPDNYQAIGNGADSGATFQLRDGFRPTSITFGPAERELTLSSWNGMRTLKTTNGDVRLFHAPNFRDKLIRRVVSSGPSTQRLVATALYGRVEVARTTRVDARGEPIPAEPIVLRGTTAVPQFSRNGTRLLTLSGGQNALDILRVSDVSMLNDSRPPPVANFKGTPPIWLADLAAAVSALDAANDGSLLTLKQVRKKHQKQKGAGPYDIVWRRFFPEEKSNGRLETGR